jgi:hypothetical protein
VRSYPVHPLEEAISIATAIQEVNSGLPFDRVLLAKALSTTPASSSFTMKLNSSTKYGLTRGGYNDQRIALTSRGEAIAAPKQSGERQGALLAAAMQPELFRRLYQALDGKRMPEDEYARNMLQRDYEVQPSLTDECLQIIKKNGLFVGILGEVAGSLYVSKSGAHMTPDHAGEDGPAEVAQIGGSPAGPQAGTLSASPRQEGPGSGIFIGHVGADDVAGFLQQALGSLGVDCDAVETGGDQALPSGDVSQAMRSSGAAVLLLTRSADALDESPDEAERKERMIFVMGAAAAIYGDRIVLARESGLGETAQGSSFRTLQFRRDNLEALALHILHELYRMGVVEVRVQA